MTITSEEFKVLEQTFEKESSSRKKGKKDLLKEMETHIRSLSVKTGRQDTSLSDVVEYFSENWEKLSENEYRFMNEIRRIVGRKRYDTDFSVRFEKYRSEHKGSTLTDFICSVFKIHRAAAKKTDILSKLQYPVIYEYSRHFGLNPEYFLLPDEVSEEDMYLENVTEENYGKKDIRNYYSDACTLFTGFNDVNSYYGYCSSTTGTQIDKFKLIFSDCGEASLTLIATNNHRRVNETTVIKEFRGTPFQIRGNVVITFTRCDNPQKDDIFILMFKLGEGNEYCYMGALLTTHRHSDKRCEIQEFVMFDKELPPDDSELAEYMKGFLKLSSTADSCVSSINQFVIEKSVLDAISEETGHTFDSYRDDENICYMINEDDFLNRYKNKSPEPLLLKLKSRAVNPSKIDIDIPSAGGRLVDFFYDRAKAYASKKQEG